ncbi:hypothetical protein BJ170DRAFT_198618 [Xylariales sp. AK1849]|nr:hypothetical protein BJ170DRAFT_198618 [Xylariales sp. AK1849]
MSSSILTLIGWSFLPNLATSWIQSIFYSLTIRAGDPKPAPNTPRFLEHRRRIHILVVSLYLLYTLYEADYELSRSSNFYADLGVPFSASERDVKSRFRRVAALHHPDKVAPNSGAGDNGELYMHLKTASDVLVDPAKRFAYERFGPEIVGWKHCSSIRDYVLRGCQDLVPYYGVAAAVMYLLGLLGYLEWGRYWRWLTLVVLCVFELHTVTRPSFPGFVEVVVNPLLVKFTGHAPYLPFQVISLARKCSITLYIAFSQIGPLLMNAPGQPPGVKRGDVSEKALQQGLERLEQTARSLDVDAARLMELEMAPFAGDPGAVTGMRAKLKEWLVQNTIRSDPMVRDALGRSFQKRRVDAPAGAKGNR